MIPQHSNYDSIILGGGAAGLMCAIHAAQRGRKVLVLDHGESVGRKILVSGGGRCNFTNRSVSSENYLTQNPHFTKSALARYTSQDFIDLVEKYRIPYEERKHGQLFCLQSARDIRQMLLRETAALGVEILTSTMIQEVDKTDHFQVLTHRGSYYAPVLVVATGGLSMPKIGATDIAYRLAKKFGIPRIPQRPGLVGLRFDTAMQKRFCPLSGISFPVEATCQGARFQENALITHHGLSGPVVLQISSYANGNAPVEINLLPGKNVKQWLLSDTKNPLLKRLSQELPFRFVEAWLHEYGLPRPLAQCRKEDIDIFIRNLEAWSPGFPSTDGYQKAEVTVGGVDTKALSSKTMESQAVRGLFFIGECVDVTGWLGGYNFQWAWSSGAAAGRAV